MVLVEELLQNTKVTVVGLDGNKNKKLHLYPYVVVPQLTLAFNQLHVCTMLQILFRQEYIKILWF